MGDRPALTDAQWRLFYVAVWAIAAGVGLILATNILMEAHTYRTPPPVWRPFVTELTGALAFAALAPLLRHFDERYPFRRDAIRRAFFAHALFTFVYVALQIGLFVVLRWLLYPLFGARHHMDDDLWLGFVYEYRKSLLGYVAVLASMYAYRHYLQLERLLAMPEADTTAPELDARDAAVSRAEETSAPTDADPADATPTRARPVTQFMARANHREYIVPTHAVEYVEAAGNYSVLHAPGGPFRVRQTMASLEQALDAAEFVRVHRSYLVRRTAIREIQPWFHGDKKLVLASGAVVNLSRRYRERIADVPSVTA